MASIELVDCRFCGLPADVVNRYALESTQGSVPHVQTFCVNRHVYNGPEE